MANAIEMKVGNVININNANYKVLKTEHVKPGKGGAFIQAELKEIQTGSRLNTRFRSDESVNIVFIERQKATFMYDSGENVVFMLSETFDQINVNHDTVGNTRFFLTEDMEIYIEMIDEGVVGITLPPRVEDVVIETDISLKNQTATSSFKHAVLRNGFKVMVPPFVNIGDTIILSTETFEYVERKK